MKLRPGETVRAISATHTLSKRGLSLLRAKRVVETMLASGRAVVQLPMVEDQRELLRELNDAGCDASALDPAPIDVAALRMRLGLSQEEFALRYGLSPGTVRNWETHRREPDAAAMCYLRVIDRHPELASEALERPLSR